MAGTLYEMLWDSHVVAHEADDVCLLYIDRRLRHEVSSPQAFTGLVARGMTPRRPLANLAVADQIMIP